jgi:putative pyrroloquinoline-quinone binding quinoprotein
VFYQPLTSQIPGSTEAFHNPNSVRLALLALILFAYVPNYFGQKPALTNAPRAERIVWVGKAGVKRFRLQIANDKQFNDVMFDGLVAGSEYVARDLDPGHYYWRVAPAESTRRQFLKVAQFEVKPATPDKQPAPLTASPITHAVAPGWFVTTGEIAAPVAAQLRRGADPDFLGVNSEGTVYALDGLRGVALWTARYTLDAKRGSKPSLPIRLFLPLIVDGIVSDANSDSLVIVAFQKGLRALESSTGQEFWSTALNGSIVGGLAADVNPKAGPELYLSDERQERLIILDAITGNVQSMSKLSGKPVGAPVLVTAKNSPVLLIPLVAGAIDVRKNDGAHVQTIKLGSAMTTPPIVVETARGLLILVGTTGGLAAFDANSFQPLGRFAIENDYPVGSLSMTDLDGDNKADIAVIITNLGRVANVKLSDGTIQWIVEGFGLANAAAFADMDGDGRPDLLLPGSKSFAVGLSRDDGSKIWESPPTDSSNPGPRSPMRTRRLAAATMKDGRVMIVGNDPSSVGLRAIELPKSVAAPAPK